MHIADAQREVRTTFLGGFAGQLVSGVLWGLSAALATWSTPRRAILLLVVGGMFIFPATQLLLKAMGRRAALDRANPMGQLAMQIAFTVPLALPLIGAAALHRLEWFYPAFLLVVGAHYLPFMFLYGMPHFGALGAAMIGAGLVIGLHWTQPFGLGGWVGAALLIVFAFVGRAQVAREQVPAG